MYTKSHTYTITLLTHTLSHTHDYFTLTPLGPLAVHHDHHHLNKNNIKHTSTHTLTHHNYSHPTPKHLKTLYIDIDAHRLCITLYFHYHHRVCLSPSFSLQNPPNPLPTSSSSNLALMPFLTPPSPFSPSSSSAPHFFTSTAFLNSVPPKPFLPPLLPPPPSSTLLHPSPSFLLRHFHHLPPLLPPPPSPYSTLLLPSPSFHFHHFHPHLLHTSKTFLSPGEREREKERETLTHRDHYWGCFSSRIRKKKKNCPTCSCGSTLTLFQPWLRWLVLHSSREYCLLPERCLSCWSSFSSSSKRRWRCGGTRRMKDEE